MMVQCVLEMHLEEEKNVFPWEKGRGVALHAVVTSAVYIIKFGCFAVVSNQPHSGKDE